MSEQNGEKGYRVSFGSGENILKLTVVMVVQFCEQSRNTELSTPLQWVSCMVYELYPNKSD